MDFLLPGSGLRSVARRLSMLATAALIGTASLSIRAQENNPYTLHVYTNLVQVPALVLTPQFELAPSIPASQFSISLDAGPPFHPTKMRPEGDEPISLAVLIDDSRDPFLRLPLLGEALAALAPKLLHPQDRVSIFAVDCALVRSMDNVPADAALLKRGVASALAAPLLHGGKQKPACSGTVPLWDAVGRVSTDLAQAQGWRVMLIVSTGQNGKSTRSFTSIEEDAASKGVSIFGLRDRTLYQPESAFGSYAREAGGRLSVSATPPPDLLASLCSSNGGILISGMPDDVRTNLEKFLTLVRSRYIIEFPRPDESEPGVHGIVISVPHQDFFIASAGVTVPSLDPKIKTDPNTVQGARSPAVLGTRRPDPGKP